MRHIYNALNHSKFDSCCIFGIYTIHISFEQMHSIDLQCLDDMCHEYFHFKAWDLQCIALSRSHALKMLYHTCFAQTSYLSFFLHKCTFWAQFFSTWKRVNCGKISQNFSKFPKISQNFSTWQFFLHEYNSWYLWQLWALERTYMHNIILKTPNRGAGVHRVWDYLLLFDSRVFQLKVLSTIYNAH